jgi:hypothetical protein
MSNGNGGNNCVETVRSGENYYLLKAGAYELGPLAVMTTVEYNKRRQTAYDSKLEWPQGEVTPNVTHMFGEEGVPEVLSEGEIYAYGRTMDAGLLDELADKEQVIARENLQHLGEINPYASAA